MHVDQKKEKAKQAYKKPRLRIIELAADEVLAIGCKTPGKGPPNVGNAVNCHAPTTCAGPGS